MGRGLGLAELGNKAELDQLGLELWLNWSLEDFPGWGGGGGGEKLGIKLKLSFSWGLGLAELGNNSRLTLTSCSKAEFTCSDGHCVSLEQRCDGRTDCQDESDEQECKAFVTYDGYKKFLAPPPVRNEKKLLLNVSINIDKIIEINDNDGFFMTKWTMNRKWLNPQLTYQNLKRSPVKNRISVDEIKKIWTPWFVFENIRYKDDTKRSDKKDVMMIIPNQEFNFKLSDKTNFQNTRLFKGDENVIDFYKQYTTKWVCDFDMRWYPFDNQICRMDMIHCTHSEVEDSVATICGLKD